VDMDFDGEWDGPDDARCSGFLVSATVFVTAAHCVYWWEGYGLEDVGVSFDPAFNAETSTVYPVADWAYNSDFDSVTYRNDVGVLVLEEPGVENIPYLQLRAWACSTR